MLDMRRDMNIGMIGKNAAVCMPVVLFALQSVTCSFV